MFLRKFVKQFSRAHHHHLTIPYYPKGFKNPPSDVACKQLITKVYEFDESGFIFAFNNLISSIKHKDFYEFAQNTCDPLLVEGFKTGMEKLKADGRNVEVVFDPEIEEEISFAHPPTFLIEVDQNKSIYSQSANFEISFGSKKCEYYMPTGFATPLVTMSLGCYIKCSTSLEIQGVDVHPYSFHFVEFQLIKDPKLQVAPSWKILYEDDMNTLVIGKDYQWRIINIDGFLKKPK